MQHKQRRLQPHLPGAALAAPWEMSQAQFEAQAVCAAVDAAMSRGKLQLQPAGDEDRQALERLQELAALSAPASVADPAAWAAGGVQRLLAHVFQNDLLVGELPGIAHVVLVKKAQMPEGMSVPELLRRVHMRQVEDALAAGEPVPANVVDEYRASMERMHVLPSHVQHEVLH
jgi:hypothetical protein